jgi:hypothetical protein
LGFAEVTKKGVTQVYGILCPSRSQYMFGLLWIVEERISGYFRMGGLHPFSVKMGNPIGVEMQH